MLRLRHCLAAVSLGALLTLGCSHLPGSKPAKPEAAVPAFGGTRTTFEVEGCRAFLISPPSPAPDGTKPWVWYAPTINRYPNAALTWLFERLLAQGFYIAGIDVGETYANPASRAQFDAFYRHVTRRHGLAAKACLLAQSRGGLNHYLFAARRPEWVQCIAGIYPVGDLRSYPGLGRAAPAYGVTEGELEAQLSSHNPIENLAPIARAGIPVLHVHGDADRIVPLEHNSGAIQERYRALGGRMDVIVVARKGHAEIPAFFESEPLLRFLLTQGGLSPR